MNLRNPSLNTPAKALLFGRVVWGVMIFSCIVVAVVMMVMVHGARVDVTPPADAGTLLVISAAVTIVAIPLAFTMRGLLFKRGWVGDVVTPVAFLQGTIVSYVIGKGAYLGTMTLALINHMAPLFWIAPTIIFIALLLLWPNGRAMYRLRSTEDRNPCRTKR